MGRRRSCELAGYVFGFAWRGYGWVPIDPQGGDKSAPRDRAMNIGRLSNRFLITTCGGGDSEYLGWTYNYDQTYQTDPQVQVSVECFAEWEPQP